jgi:hypothetical protein
MYHDVCACLCFSIFVYTISVSCCTIELYIDCTYMVRTCLYMFMPCGQDSRWPGDPETVAAARRWRSGARSTPAQLTNRVIGPRTPAPRPQADGAGDGRVVVMSAAQPAARGGRAGDGGVSPGPPGPDWLRRAHRTACDRRQHEGAEPVAEVTSMRVGEAAQRDRAGLGPASCGPNLLAHRPA